MTYKLNILQSNTIVFGQQLKGKINKKKYLNNIKFNRKLKRTNLSSLQRSQIENFMQKTSQYNTRIITPNLIKRFEIYKRQTQFLSLLQTQNEINLKLINTNFKEEQKDFKEASAIYQITRGICSSIFPVQEWKKIGCFVIKNLRTFQTLLIKKVLEIMDENQTQNRCRDFLPKLRAIEIVKNLQWYLKQNTKDVLGQSKTSHFLTNYSSFLISPLEVAFILLIAFDKNYQNLKLEKWRNGEVQDS
ncbi:unnamed protein product [Paramecium octaurelia]|uniref:Uncharacterized protein n=1 Tax=Paramecium octaurelia TaxID=43137 RepID=A0A8S1YRJ1_PAROT|nr:unnamed protein product [Paramecium octaurelia]